MKLKPKIRFVILASQGQFRFRITSAANGKILASSEHYRRKTDALRAVRSIIAHVQCGTYEVKQPQ